MAVLATLYMWIFLPESYTLESHPSLSTKLIENDDEVSENAGSNTGCSWRKELFKGMPSVADIISLINTSSTFSQAAVVAFFNNFGDMGLHTAILYFLKARFHFTKNQFADFMVIGGIAATVCQLLLMPLLVPAIGQERLLTLGLFFNCAHMFLYSIAWSSWVPYISAMFSILICVSKPCLRSIASTQVGSSEQGKAQGCISGICSLANVIAPLVCTPLTALFLSEGAPFSFPGFSIMCIGFAPMFAFIQSLLMRSSRFMSSSDVSNCNFVA